MSMIIFTALPIIFLFYLLHRHNKKPTKTNGPRGLPLIGNLHQLAGETSPHIYFWKLAKLYGPLVHLNLGHTRVIVISTAKLAEEVLKTQDLTFCSRPKLVAQQRLSYDGSDMVFAPYGAHWREARRIAATHLLSPTKVQSFRQVRADEVARMVAKIIASSSPVVDLSEAAMGLMISLISRIGLGMQRTKLRRFEETVGELRRLLSTFFVSDYFPALSWVDKASGLRKRLDRAYEKVDSFYQDLIDDHLRRGGVEEEEEEDILHMAIKFELASTQPNWDRVKALLMNILIGGTDSSAASIVWNMTALMKAPSVMKKVQAEIRNVVGSKDRVDEDDLPKLPYLKAILKETFRLYSPVPMLIPRETTAKCTLHGCEIAPKTTVYVNVWAIGRDPEYWKESPDEYLPERFLGSGIDVKGQDFGAIPFGSGRRICPGMHMGLANVELAVANLLYCFDWELPAGVRIQDIDTDASPGVIMHKKTPLLLVPKQYI